MVHATPRNVTNGYTVGTVFSVRSSPMAASPNKVKLMETVFSLGSVPRIYKKNQQDKHDLCDENHKRRVEAMVQALLEAKTTILWKKVRTCDIQKWIKSSKLRMACGTVGIPNEFSHFPRSKSGPKTRLRWQICRIQVSLDSVHGIARHCNVRVWDLRNAWP
jgi:hypothetical protein